MPNIKPSAISANNILSLAFVIAVSSASTLICAKTASSLGEEQNTIRLGKPNHSLIRLIAIIGIKHLKVCFMMKHLIAFLIHSHLHLLSSVIQ
jgi:hypothetical protein